MKKILAAALIAAAFPVFAQAADVFVYHCEKNGTVVEYNRTESRIWLRVKNPVKVGHGGWHGVVNPDQSIAWSNPYPETLPAQVPVKFWVDQHGRAILQGSDPLDRIGCVVQQGFLPN